MRVVFFRFFFRKLLCREFLQVSFLYEVRFCFFLVVNFVCLEPWHARPPVPPSDPPTTSTYTCTRYRLPQTTQLLTGLLTGPSRFKGACICHGRAVLSKRACRTVNRYQVTRCRTNGSLEDRAAPTCTLVYSSTRRASMSVCSLHQCCSNRQT